MPKNRDHHEVLLVAGTLYRLEKRTGWQYASCPLTLAVRTEERKKRKKKKKRNEKNTDGEEWRRGCLCHGAAGR